MTTATRRGFGVEVGPDRVQTSVVVVRPDAAVEVTVGPVDRPPSADDPATIPEATNAPPTPAVLAAEAQRQLAVLGHGHGDGVVHLAVWDTAWEMVTPDGQPPAAAADSGDLDDRARLLSNRLIDFGVTVRSFSTSTAAVSGIGPSEADAIVWTGPRTATIVRRPPDRAATAQTVARDQLPPPWRYGGLGRFPSPVLEQSAHPGDLLGPLFGAGGVAGELTIAGHALELVAPKGARGPVPLPFAAIGAAAVAGGLYA